MTDRLRREIEAIKPWEFHHAGIVDELLPRSTVMALLDAAPPPTVELCGGLHGPNCICWGDLSPLCPVHGKAIDRKRLIAALEVHWYAERPLVGLDGADLDDVLRVDAEIIAAEYDRLAAIAAD